MARDWAELHKEYEAQDMFAEEVEGEMETGKSAEDIAEGLWRRRTRLPDVVIRAGEDLEEIARMAQAIREAEERGRFAAYDKARELVGFSNNACNVIEAQMQVEFPDRAFVTSQQMRSGSRMDGSNMRMPKTPNQLREEGRVEEREACALVCDRYSAFQKEELGDMGNCVIKTRLEGRKDGAEKCAHTIRARSTAPQSQEVKG